MSATKFFPYLIHSLQIQVGNTYFQEIIQSIIIPPFLSSISKNQMYVIFIIVTNFIWIVDEQKLTIKIVSKQKESALSSK